MDREIKKLFDGMPADVPLCNVMSALLGKIFNCDYVFIFIYNERWGKLIERAIRTSPDVPYIDFNPGVLGPGLVKSAFKQPYFLDPENIQKIGLGSKASVIVASTGDNKFLRGAVAIAKDTGTAWTEADLEKLGTTVVLIIRCYELSVTLAENEQYANTIVESVDTAIFAISLDGTIIHFNSAAEAIFGYPADWAIGRHYLDTLRPEHRESFKRSMDYVLNKGKAYEAHYIKFKRLDNQEIYISNFFNPWLNAEGDLMGVIGIVRNETETKLYQEKLIKAEKMAVLGQIAAQVSHEVRSPLASIRGFARIIEKNESPGTRYKEYAETIIEQVDRINRVVQELLDFSKPEEDRYQKIDVNQALRKAIKVAGIDKGDIRIIENLGENIPAISGDYQKIECIFVNLLVNAYQSITDNGIIKICTSASPDGVVIEIVDNGCGIPEEYMDKIFDPYFTTKDTGTGLGLAIVQQVANTHGAKIRVSSDEGLGTSFRLEFPLGSDRDHEE
ncbi:MAG: PAS domain S-box protein [Firmicutes bacterium]|nr:PAS domain S-box protein [Bacillota bacterium]